MFKISSFNVNSINVRLEIVTHYIIENKIDVLFLQEIKCTNENFPYKEFEKLGYHVEVNGQKSYNGVAIISKFPIKLVSKTIPFLNDESDIQARFLEVKILDYRMICVYVPNGNPIDSEKYLYKLNWLNKLYEYCEKINLTNEKIIIGGDFNIIQESFDCYDTNAWTNDALFSDEVKRLLRQIKNLGFLDSFRVLKPNLQRYSFWDYQSGAWQKDNGIRIDLFLISASVVDLLIEVGIDQKQRSLERPSDHTPVWIELLNN
tara:strand:+ start:2112 stop:2894 length:783 start_codon:yes stop_codon:yes gene_type:complete